MHRSCDCISRNVVLDLLNRPCYSLINCRNYQIGKRPLSRRLSAYTRAYRLHSAQQKGNKQVEQRADPSRHFLQKHASRGLSTIRSSNFSIIGTAAARENNAARRLSQRRPIHSLPSPFLRDVPFSGYASAFADATSLGFGVAQAPGKKSRPGFRRLRKREPL